jgi:Thiamine pyrophosphate-requiring enzymes [acetolactate synthase, pyruvate dehydrogenase (cytochrome), glyoxylate carboligase, phosphonopyruvate decarboxylase]
MPVYDAFYHYQDKLKHYLVRHEQGAIHAAQGYARVKGKAGVAIATSGLVQLTSLQASQML